MKKISAHFKLSERISNFLGRFPNKTQAVEGLVAQEVDAEERQFDLISLYDDPSTSIKTIEELFAANESLTNNQYKFLVAKVHDGFYSFSFNQNDKITIQDKTDLICALLELVTWIYRAGRKLDMEGFYISKLNVGQKGDYPDTIQDALLNLKNKVSQQEYVDMELVTRVFGGIMRESVVDKLDLDRYLSAYLEVLIKIAAKSIGEDEVRSAKNKQRDIEDKAKFTLALNEWSDDEFPVVFGASRNSIARVSLYKDINDRLVAIIRETDIGYSSVTNFVEEIAQKSVNKFFPDGKMEPVTWYQINLDGTIDLVQFDTQSLQVFKHPNWVKVSKSAFEEQSAFFKVIRRSC
ncbi:hypothetical protein [Hydrogenovibrio marinus]|uniref:Uncharacterized protein n=1 Tax=Hydrogenovibrio marinus TaxID=28885 RepID=A0A066ZLD5_HYDMR|nr:hypothetical protein [Hydrogenovibrio marinus]KDN94618.1 hypothetical protein EI16_11990 [Hydrogenovibrio marinus]